MRHALLPALSLAVALIAIIAALAARGDRPAAATTALPPDLRALPASQPSIDTSGGGKLLRFSTTSWNGGAGKLHLIGGATDGGTGTQEVYQRVFNDDGTYQDYLAGAFVWHPAHDHTHFDDYAMYILRPVTPGIADRIANKTTFCIIDTTAVDLSLPGAPQSGQYQFCTADYQGLSVGWGDTYPWNLAGQSIDVAGQPNGDYYLTIEIDSDGRIVESNDANNSSTIVVRITGNSVAIVNATPTPTATATPTATRTATPTITDTPTITNTPTPTRTPGTSLDSDGDGCTDWEEVGPEPLYGGQRDPANQWDFYDVNGSRKVDAADIAMVRSRFNVLPADPIYDRSPGAAAWASGPPDGQIDAIDIGLARASFNHSCQAPP